MPYVSKKKLNKIKNVCFEKDIFKAIMDNVENTDYSLPPEFWTKYSKEIYEAVYDVVNEYKKTILNILK